MSDDPNPAGTIRLLDDKDEAGHPFLSLLGKLFLMLLAGSVLVVTVRWIDGAPLKVKAAELSDDNATLLATNALLQRAVSDYEAKIKDADQLNVALRRQLDLAAAQLSNALQTAQVTVDQVRPIKASREAIRALRKFHASPPSSISYDQYARNFQDLKTLLDENRPAIPDGEFKNAVEEGFHDFRDAFDLWTVALGKSTNDFSSILKKRDWWHGKKGDFRFDKFVKANRREPTEQELLALNAPVPGYTLDYGLKKITEEAAAQIDLAESKLK